MRREFFARRQHTLPGKRNSEEHFLAAIGDDLKLNDFLGFFRNVFDNGTWTLLRGTPP